MYGWLRMLRPETSARSNGLDLSRVRWWQRAVLGELSLRESSRVFVQESLFHASAKHYAAVVHNDVGAIR